MKLHLNEYLFENYDILTEMAQIGYIGPYQIYIHTNDPGNTPHFHIWDLSTRGKNFHTCVRIDCPKYFHHTGKEYVLNSKQRKELMSFLNNIDKDSGFTNWKWLILEWNRYNSNVRIDVNTSIPDYTQLK